ncbi:MAG: ABC transporter permease [Ferruginibacter sp.]|nr:ABC transporter permease [Cytophagales bacterium]
MNKIFLILKREYLVRVQKKSFIIMTLLVPLLTGGFMAGVVFLSTRSIKDKVVQVVDESGLFKGKFTDGRDVKFVYSALTVDKAKRALPQSDYQALLYIPAIDVQKPKGIVLFAGKNVSMLLQNRIEDVLDQELESLRLQKVGIDKAVLASTKSKVAIATVALSEEGEKTSSSGAAFAVGYACAFLIYMSVFIYGAQVMRGVLEEKTSRIVEVIISSVKPFQLMLGKITGVALVGLTQFLLWIVLGFAIATFTSAAFGLDKKAVVRTEKPADRAKDTPNPTADNPLAGAAAALQTMNVPLILGTFLFYFLGGYLLYSALFAAIGAAADSETDTQQFMFPITIPLIASIVVAQVVLQDPDGSVAFWMSMFPLTSPILMMVRIPFGVPPWQLLLSMTLLVAGFVATTWLAARIYRVGILMYGKKVNFRELSKWVFYKG